MKKRVTSRGGQEAHSRSRRTNTTTVRSVRYVECQRNHAAKIGGHAVDGCREFMATGTADEMKCAACGCHRNFHRRHVEFEVVCECASPSSSNEK